MSQSYTFFTWKLICCSVFDALFQTIVSIFDKYSYFLTKITCFYMSGTYAKKSEFSIFVWGIRMSTYVTTSPYIIMHALSCCVVNEVWHLSYLRCTNAGIHCWWITTPYGYGGEEGSVLTCVWWCGISVTSALDCMSNILFVYRIDTHQTTNYMFLYGQIP